MTAMTQTTLPVQELLTNLLLAVVASAVAIAAHGMSGGELCGDDPHRTE